MELNEVLQLYYTVNESEHTMTDRAIDELKRAGLYNKDSDYEGMTGKAVEELLKVFQKQRHSGFSASLVANLFNKLVKGEVLSPLTTDESEWNDVALMDGSEKGKMYQSRRCPFIFTTTEKLKEGKAYTLDGIVFREPNGACYTSNDSRVWFSLPGYPPKTVYKDVPAHKDENMEDRKLYHIQLNEQFGETLILKDSKFELNEDIIKTLQFLNESKLDTEGIVQGPPDEDGLKDEKKLEVGKHNDVPTEDFDPEQIKIGMEIEKEHSDDPAICLAIAKDHCAEFSSYYTYLTKMEAQMKADGIKGVKKNENSELIESELDAPLENYEYLIHHVETDKKGTEDLHHCFVYDHLGNMFTQEHLIVKNGKSDKPDGVYHVIDGLEPTQDVCWSDEEAKEKGIEPKRMTAGMSFKDKSKEW